MKTKICVLLLAAVLVLSMITGAIAAPGSSAQLSVTAGYQGGQIAASVSLRAGEGVTNGRIAVTYDPAAVILTDIRIPAELPIASVNQETDGVVSLAWVGSALTADETQMLELNFRPVEGTERDVTLTARAEELYAGEATMEAEEGSVTVIRNPFTDIDAHWAKEEILKAYHAGLFVGMSESRFSPEKKLDRAMFVTVLYRMAGRPAVERTDTRFKDVKPGTYYADAVAWAVEAGVTCGITRNTFAPHKPIDRQEAATMLYRYAKASGRDVNARADLSGYKDAGKIAGWAGDAMAWAVAEELIKGYPNGYLAPRGNTTRAEAAVIVVRYAGL
ncbi:MAG: S-layer homology domain-containing protein [Faecousia sp.]